MSDLLKLLGKLEGQQTVLDSQAEGFKDRRAQLRTEVLNYQEKELKAFANLKTLVKDQSAAENDCETFKREYLYLTAGLEDDEEPSGDCLMAEKSREIGKNLVKLDLLEKSHQMVQQFAEKHRKELETFRAECLVAEKHFSILGKTLRCLKQVESDLSVLRKIHGSLELLTEERTSLEQRLARGRRQRLSRQVELKKLYSLLAERRSLISSLESLQMEEEKKLLFQKENLIEKIRLCEESQEFEELADSLGVSVEFANM